MYFNKILFWPKLALVVITSFIVITYIFKPTDNQCQMTFMMEPPRFIPIPIDIATQYNMDDISSSSNEKQRNDNGYKLYMYSEFGFPSESDVRRDLKDSMPVLFVPGNAGSYQQVRSLASTCIRRQLQALDAFKFIFYTIDFRAQLSGLSGDLVENQIDFLDLAINQIVKIHPTETNGVIVVGHSVGGFVAKALLARPDFDSNLMPLLISLASPLTRPFVNFDYRMQQLYNETNALWPGKQINSSTLAISISGGKSDRLVPPHLSLDPQYDISLTTNSIDDVWLATDHVSITWCRELMNKISRILSSLMDKKRTRLIEKKVDQLERVTDELFTSSPSRSNTEDIVPKMDMKPIFDSVKVIQDNFLVTRSELLESPVVLNFANRDHGDIFIWLEHIDNFKETAIFGCQDIHRSASKVTCIDRINLYEYFRKVPSRRHELKKKALLMSDDKRKLRYLVFDFGVALRDDSRKNKVPESISVQVIQKEQSKELHVPNLSSYLLSSLFKSSNLVLDRMKSKEQPKAYARYKLVNLDSANQYFNILVESKLCRTSDRPSETIALLTQGQYVRETFHLEKKLAAVIIKLDAHEKVMFHHSRDRSQLYLELYLDGSCEHELKIRLDIWSFIENLIQTNPGEIMACSCYLAYCSILLHTSLLLKLSYKLQVESPLLNCVMGFVGFIVVYLTSRMNTIESANAAHQVLVFCVIATLSSGLVALVEYMVNRLVDLATIVYNFQTLIRDKIMNNGTNSPSAPNKFVSSNGASPKACERKDDGLDYEWPVVILTAFGSLFLSEALMRLCVLFMMLKLMLRISIIKLKSSPTDATKANVAQDRVTSSSRTCDRDYDCAYNMALSMTTICIMGSICSVPTALLMVNSARLKMQIDASYLACLCSMVVVKAVNQSVDESYIKGVKGSSRTMLHYISAFTPKHIHMITLLPMILVSRNIRVMNHVELMTLIWVASSLYKYESANGKRKTD